MNVKLFFKWMAISVGAFLALNFGLSFIIAAIADAGTASMKRAAEEQAAAEASKPASLAPTAPVVVPAGTRVAAADAELAVDEPLVVPEQRPLQIGGLYRTNANYVAAATREKFARALEIASQRDEAAFAQLLLSDPEVILLQPDLEVHLSEIAPSGMAVRIRLKGSLAEVWTLRQAIER
jgi:hypothetical protein